MGHAVPRAPSELILLGITESDLPARSALRKVGRAAAADRGTSRRLDAAGDDRRRSDTPAARRRGHAATERPREQTRARYPDAHGLRRARRRPDLLRGLRRRASRPSCSMPTWSIIHSRHWKLQIPYLARHSRVVTFDGRGNGRSDRPADPAAYREEEFAADALAVMDATAHGAGGRWSRLSTGRRTVAAPRGRSPRAGRADRLHRSGRAAGARRASCGREPGVPGAARHVRRLGEVQPPLLGRALRGLPRVLLLAVPHRAALHEAARGHRRLGARDGRPDARRHPAGAPAPGRGGRAGAAVPDRLSDPRDPRQRRPRAPVGIGCATRGAGERRARRPRRVRPPPPRPRPGQGQPAAPRLHRHWAGRDDDA